MGVAANASSLPPIFLRQFATLCKSPRPAAIAVAKSPYMSVIALWLLKNSLARKWATLHRFSLTVQKNSFVATNSTGIVFTNPFNQRVQSSFPACSLGTCPITINALLRPCVTRPLHIPPSPIRAFRQPATPARHFAPAHGSLSRTPQPLD